MTAKSFDFIRYQFVLSFVISYYYCTNLPAKSRAVTFSNVSAFVAMMMVFLSENEYKKTILLSFPRNTLASRFLTTASSKATFLSSTWSLVNAATVGYGGMKSGPRSSLKLFSHESIPAKAFW